MTTPLFDAHGHTVHDPADGWHTNDEINAFIDAINDIPKSDRVAYFNAVRVHHDHQHFVVDPDNVFMSLAKDGSIILKSIPMDTSGITGRPDFLVNH